MPEINQIVALPVLDSEQDVGIDYAGRSLNYTYDRMRYGFNKSRLIRIMVGVVVERVLERYLLSGGIAFGLTGRTHWRAKDQAEFVIDRQRLDVKGYHVYPSSGRVFPEWLLDVEALVPQGQLDFREPAALYLHAFLVANQANHSAQHAFVVVPPTAWSDGFTPRAVSLRRPARETATALELRLGGETSRGTDVLQVAQLKPNEPWQAAGGLCSVEYLRSGDRPGLQIQIAAEGLDPFTAGQDDWCDLWLEDPVVYLGGWASHGEFARARLYPTGSRTAVYTGGTRTQNRGLLLRELRAVAELGR